MAECEKQFFTCDGNNVNNGALPAEPLWENKTLSQIYLNSFIYCFFYNDIWLGYRNRMQIKSPPPCPFFIWLLKRCCWFTIGNVLFVLFFLSCLQRAALLIAVDKLSVTLYENSLHSDTANFFTGDRIRKERGGKLQLAWRKLLIKYSIKQSYFVRDFTQIFALIWWGVHYYQRVLIC